MLAELHAKYDALVRLREAQDRGDAHDPRPELRALAARHPGALRELDVLPLQVLCERRDLLARALAGAPPPRWAAPMASFHAHLRAALAARRLAPGRRGERLVPWALAQVAAEHGLHPDEVARLVLPRRT